mgnify:CR=1 FL=1
MQFGQPLLKVAAPQQADAEARQKREIETIRAREEAETIKVKEEERLKAEQARIQSQQEIELIELNADFIQRFDHVLYW